MQLWSIIAITSGGYAATDAKSRIQKQNIYGKGLPKPFHPSTLEQSTSELDNHNLETLLQEDRHINILRRNIFATPPNNYSKI
jgi:hypothetical protein